MPNIPNLKITNFYYSLCADGTTGLAGTTPHSLRNYSEPYFTPLRRFMTTSECFRVEWYSSEQKGALKFIWAPYSSRELPPFCVLKKWQSTEDQPVRATSICAFSGMEDHLHPLLGLLKTHGWPPWASACIKVLASFSFLKHSSLMNNFLIIMAWIKVSS